jgi:hypothetical protein
MTGLVRELVPTVGQAAIDDVLARVRDAPVLEPFCDELISACDAVSRALLGDVAARRMPELVALAYWLRRSSSIALRDGFAEGDTDVAVLRPRGVAFHVPPTNVDTMAMYSLALSMLVGNRNVVRISPRAGAALERICSALNVALADPAHAAVRAGTALISYGHEHAPTAACSAACDVRVLWGGDATIAALRAIPLTPGAHEIAFADRFSLAAVAVDAWEAAAEPERAELARRLFNDAYWFDQNGCASPRLVLWRGPPGAADRASSELFALLDAELRQRGLELALGAETAKQAFVAGAAIDRPVAAVRRFSNELTVVTLTSLDGLRRDHPAGGLFLEATVSDLADFAAVTTRKDQTMTAFGFPADELRAFATAAAGRGVDRIVPFGEALSFGRHWDGMDLLRELTREVVIDAHAPAAVRLRA